MPWQEKKTLGGMAYYLQTDTQEVSWNKPEALMTAEEIEENKGEWVWVPHPTDMWQPARVVKKDGDGTVHVRLENNKGMKIPKSRMMDGPECGGRKQMVPLWELKKGNLRFLEDDLVMLDPVNEAFIIRNLAQRYADGNIYTWVGAGRSVLVSVNPYQNLNLYTQAQIELHRNKPSNVEIHPHVFDIANDSYDSMAFDGGNQSILISGESGAGKTEATKQCLQYLAAIADSDTNAEEKVLVANPLLEAFGNAKTIRNINSSRFGKWIEVYFDKQTTKMCGARITNYLLERSRVVHQQKDERNFHIFYELCFNAKSKDLYKIGDPSDYRYLSQSGCVKVPQIDDQKEFADVLKAMETLEFSEEEQEHVLQLTAAVLWLGNVEFSKKMQKGSVEGSQIKKGNASSEVAKLLEIDNKKVEEILCYRTIRARGDAPVIPLPPKDARTACDSLAMGIYGKLFDWLVSRVNDALGGQPGRFIGILDIFGFEIFENNSFEQLCINYANEKLQQLFNKTTFKEEEQLYKTEGVKYTPINFIDNQPVLDLVEKKPHGILPVLDDECLVPEGSDEKFMKKIEGYHGALTSFQTDTKRRFENDLSFEIKHYAGIVRYDASLFMTKNLDTVFDDMKVAMRGSKNALLKTIFVEKKGRIKTLSYQFRNQLSTLMNVLYKTESRFIRCIKPNDELKANKFISSSCIEQLRYSGVFEAVDIRKTGYPFRYTHRRFAYRYSCINQGHNYRSRIDDELARVKEILAVSKQDFAGVQLGKTMVLYKANEYKLLRLLRNLALETIIPKQQAIVRGGMARTFARELRQKTRTLNDLLRQGNNYEGLTKAIQEADPANMPVEQRRMFKVAPHNLEVARLMNAELAEWKDLENQMQSLKAKCAGVKPDPFYDDLKRVDKEIEERKKRFASLAQAAKSDRYGRVNYVPSKMTSQQQGLHKDIQELLHQCVFRELDELAEEAVKCVSKAMLQEVLVKADELNHDSEAVVAAKDLLALSEKDFVMREYTRAQEVGDQKRITHRQIRLVELKCGNLDEAMHGVEAKGKYRTPEEFAKAKFTSRFGGKAGLIDGFKRWSNKPLPTSLIKSTREASGDKAGAKAFKTAAKANFKSILFYMGEKKSPDRNGAAQDVLRRGAKAYSDSDNDMLQELYCQIIKQLTGNVNKAGDSFEARGSPEGSSTYANALALFGMMLATFPPSTVDYSIESGQTSFDDAVIIWIQNNAGDTQRQKLLNALHNTKYGGKGKPVAGTVALRASFDDMKPEFSLEPGKDTGPGTDSKLLYLK